LGWHVIACGVAVSDDERTLAIRFVESNHIMNSGDEVRNHCVIVYHDFDRNTEEKAKPAIIPLMAQDDSSESAAHVVAKRILQLSPNGEYLLVGTRQSRSIAELHRTSDGASIHRWTTESPLGQVIIAIPNASYFADVSPDNRSIRLI